MRLRAVALFVLLLAASLVTAQTFRGAIQGTITDNQGAAIAGAQVTVTNTGTGLVRNAVTDSQGNYLISELPLGEYSVAATKDGFSKKVMTGIKVDVASRERVDLALALGQVKEVIEVREQQPLVETTTDNMGGIIETSQIEQLPISGGDFTKVLVLVPGATGDPSGGADSPGSFGLFSANGSRGRSNNYLLDGTDMNDGYRNLPAINQGGVFGTPSTILPLDALAEIPIIAEGEAEYGRNSGTIVNTVTKSGTNHIHGSVYEYFRNNGLDARNYFNPVVDPNTGSAAPQNVFHNNQFGGSIGGPIVKDRTFFFAAYEGQRENGGLTFANTVPTQGDIARANCGGALVDPFTDAPLNPIAVNIACVVQPWGPNASLPVGVCEGGPPCFGGAPMLQTVRFNNRVDSLIGKIDQHLGKNDLLTGRYFFGDSDQSFPLGLLGGAAVPGYNTVTPTRVQILSLSYTHVHSSKLLFELRGGWNRFNENFFPQDQSFDPALVGINNIGNDGQAQPFGLPLFKIGTPNGGTMYAPVGANASVPRGRVDTNWQLVGNTSYNTGKHNLKWGYEFRRTFVNQFFDAGHRGAILFSDFASFLYGDNSTAGLPHELSGDSRRHMFQNNHSLYFQDNWRLTPKITLNLGLRWDYYGVIGEKNGLLSLFDPANLSVADGGSCTDAECPAARTVSQLYPKDYNNFSPRVSVAYDLFGKGKTVLRAGYGIYYDSFSMDFFGGQLPWPTYNAGPAYNFVGSGNPASIYLSYDMTPNMGAVNAGGACPGGTIAIPNFAGWCADRLFQFSPGFGNDTFTVNQNLRTPYMQNFNVNVQQQISRNVSFQIGYVGSKGTKLAQYVDANQINPATGQMPYNFPATMGFGYLLTFGSFANSNYNSLQTSLRFQNFHGLSSVLNYTWSHSIDTASDGQDYVPNATQPDNSYDISGNRASSNFDQRHRLTWNYTYDLPFKTQSAKWLTNGWTMDGVLVIGSGMPFNVSYGSETFSTDYNNTNEFYGRPDFCGIGQAVACLPGVTSVYTGTGGVNLLNAGALVVPCDVTLGDCPNSSSHIGNVPRNAFIAPNYRNFDFSLTKMTSLGERVKMQLRADFFNIFNHPNLGSPLFPSAEVDMLHNGIDGTGHGVGFIQSTTTPDVGLGNPFLGGGGPRDIQLALKFTF